MDNSVKWNDFIKRRRLNVKKWLESNRINDSKSLLILCNKKNISPPTDQEMNLLFRKSPHKNKKATKEVKNKISEASSVQNVPKKRGRKKKTSPSVKKGWQGNS